MTEQSIVFYSGDPLAPTQSMSLNVNGITLTNLANTVILGQTGLVSSNALRITSPELRVVGHVSTPYANNKILFTTEPTFPAIHPSISITDGTITTSLTTTDLIMPALIPVAGYTSLIDTLLDITGSTGNYVTVAGPPQIITGEKTFVEPITVVDDAVTPTQTNTITGDALIFSKTSSANNITLNNSPDLINDYYPYLRLFSENPTYKYRSNLTSEGHTQTLRDFTTDDLICQIDVKPTEIGFTQNSAPSVITGGISAFYVSQQVDTTASNLFMSNGDRLQMNYSDGDTREIDIYNDKATQPYINVIGSGDVNYNYRTEINDKSIVNRMIGVSTMSDAFKAVVNAENISIFTGIVETNIVGSNYYRLSDNSGTDTLDITPYSITFKSSGTPINTLTTLNWSGNIQTVNTVANLTHYINFSDSAGTGYGHPQKNASLSCNPSTGTITATTFSGSLSGNASSASSISLTSDNTSGNYFIPFSKTVASNSTLFVDNTTTPLSYDPSTATLSTSQITLSDGTNTNTLDSLNWSGQIMAKNTSANATHYLLFWDDVNGATYGYPQKNSGISVNPNQHTITATTFIGGLSGTATNATHVNITSNNTSGTYYLPFVSTTGYTDMYIDNSLSTLTYNPSSSTIQVVDNLTRYAKLSPTELNMNVPTTGDSSTLSANSLTIELDTGDYTLLNNTTLNMVTSTTTSFYNSSTLSFTDGVNTNTLDALKWTGTINIRPTTSSDTHLINFSDGALYGYPLTTTNITCNPSTGLLTATTFSGSLSGNSTTATTASKVSLTSDNTSGTYFIPFSKTPASASNQLFVDDSSGPLTYNPSTSTLTSVIFSGSASTVAFTLNDVGAGTCFIPYSRTANATGNALSLDNATTPLTYVPSTGTLTATTFSGSLSGNSTTATTSINVSFPTTPVTAIYTSPILTIPASSTNSIVHFSITITGPATISSINYTTPRVGGLYRIGIFNNGTGDLTINATQGGTATTKTNLAANLAVPPSRYVYMEIHSMLINSVQNYVALITLLP